MIIFAIIFSIFIFIGIYLFFSGIFHKIEVKTGSPTFGTIYIAYKFHIGPFHEIPKAINDINAVGKNFDSKELIGIYYDDPRKVEKNKLRYVIGILLTDKNLNIDEKLEKKLNENGYKFTWITHIDNAVLAKFPMYTKFSFILAIWLVYSKLNKFIKSEKLCAYPFIEFYQRKTIDFIVPLCEQEKFFVQEYYDSVEADPYYKTVKRSNSKIKTN